MKVLDADGVVEDDGLGVLDVAKSGDIELHPAHVIGVTPHLSFPARSELNYLSACNNTLHKVKIGFASHQSF